MIGNRLGLVLETFTSSFWLAMSQSYEAGWYLNGKFLKIEGDGKDGMRKLITNTRPVGGWPTRLPNSQAGRNKGP